MNKAFEKILDGIESLKSNKGFGGTIQTMYADGMLDKAKQIVQEVAEEYDNGWIPVKTRPMTEEEKEYYSEYHFEENGMIYECTLPEDGQEVLITSKYGSVDKTTFYSDYGKYFEKYEDYDDVIAWQPLPVPFKERD